MPNPTKVVVSEVTSITITRHTHQLVAMVTNRTKAKVEVDVGNVNAKGRVVGRDGELGNLELIWNFPTESQNGEYRCEVSWLVSE